MKNTLRLRFKTIAASLLALLLLLVLPIFSWTGIHNVNPFYKAIKVDGSIAKYLAQNFTLFKLLDFVEKTKFGAIGLYAMLLLLLSIASLYFLIRGLYLLIIKKDLGTKNVDLFLPIQVAACFSGLTALATIGFSFFANTKSGVSAFFCHWPVYVTLMLSIITFAITKYVGDEIRKELLMTGFFHELKKNWVLFAMLIPTFVYFMINNYLPMIGVYYAFTSFNFRDGLWESPFIGLKNFEYLMVSDLFKLTKNTILYNIVFIGLGNIAQIFLPSWLARLPRNGLRVCPKPLCLCLILYPSLF